MTGSLLLLVGLYAGLGALVLFVLVASRLPLVLRAGIVVLVTAGYFLSWQTWNDMAGWPARSELPEHFLFHAATIVEPDQERGVGGWIYVWATTLTDDGPVGVPRSYRVEYLKKLHNEVREAEARMRNGLPQVGRKKAAPAAARSPNGALRKQVDPQNFELGTLPSPALPEK